MAFTGIKTGIPILLLSARGWIIATEGCCYLILYGRGRNAILYLFHVFLLLNKERPLFVTLKKALFFWKNENNL
jgi:hypothetical protein